MGVYLPGRRLSRGPLRLAGVPRVRFFAPGRLRLDSPPNRSGSAPAVGSSPDRGLTAASCYLATADSASAATPVLTSSTDTGGLFLLKTIVRPASRSGPNQLNKASATNEKANPAVKTARTGGNNAAANIQREDLSAIDEAKAYQKLLKEYDHTQLQLAQRLGKSQSYIAEMLGLLELDARVQDLVNQGRIGSSMARQIARLPDKDAQHQAALSVVTGSMTVVQAKQLVDQILGKKSGGEKKGAKAKGRTTLRLNTLRRAEKHVAAIAGGLKALSPKTVKPADRPKIKGLLDELRKALETALEQLGAE